MRTTRDFTKFYLLVGFLIQGVLGMSAAMADKSALIVVMGGQNSCPAPGLMIGRPAPHKSPMMVKPGAGRDAIKKISDEIGVENLRVVYSCYDFFGNLYVNSSSDLTVHKGRRWDLTPLHRRIREEASDGRPVFLIGHSHGAWTAMHAALHLPGSSQLRTVFTIDMISRENCGIMTVAKSVVAERVNGIFNRDLFDFNMTSSRSAYTKTEPASAVAKTLNWLFNRKIFVFDSGHNKQTAADFDENMKGRVLHRMLLESWHNYFQLENIYLHSSEITGKHRPTCQKLLAVSGKTIGAPIDFWLYGNSHDKLQWDNRIWNEFTDTVLDSIRNPPKELLSETTP